MNDHTYVIRIAPFIIGMTHDFKTFEDDMSIMVISQEVGKGQTEDFQDQRRSS